MAQDRDLELAFELTKTSEAARRSIAHAYADVGIDFTDIRILYRLFVFDGQSQSQLAAILELDPMTMSRCASRLESLALVRREIAATDSRVKRLFLTQKAHSLKETLRPRSAKVIDSLLGGLSDEHLEELLVCVDRLCGNLGTLGPTPATKDPTDKRGRSSD